VSTPDGSAGAAPPLRTAVVGIVTFSLFAALFARLYYLQILQPLEVAEVKGGQLLRTVPFETKRGRILDRNGKLLVDSREAIAITLDRRAYEDVSDDERDATFERLARALNRFGVPIKAADIENRLADPRFDPLEPVPIAEDVSVQTEISLLERTRDFPGIGSARSWLRTYPNGPVAAHVLGYVGAADEGDLEAKATSAKPYVPGDEIGKGGVEAMFEDSLRGTPGSRVIEVDARNVEIDERGVVAGKAGDDLVLSLDLDLQRDTEVLLQRALEDARKRPKRKPEDPDARAQAGAAVVLDAKTGEVLAIASYPTYNPADFVGGISAFRFAQLNDPAARYPLNDRAVTSAYAPGSTFKPFTAYAAVTSGLLDPNFAYRDTGTYTVLDCESEGASGCVFPNPGREPHGEVDLRRSLVVSSNTYYYRLGDLFWNHRNQFGERPIQDAAEQFGFGAPTGVQLAGEGEGLIPDPKTRKARHEANPEAFPFGDWYSGENVNIAVGQGDVLVTPLQLANAYATLANGGNRMQPSIARHLLDGQTAAVTRAFEPQVVAQVPLPANLRDSIISGLAGVVSDEDGTAHDGFAGFPLDRFSVAGKTGTAEVSPGPDQKPRADTSIFAAFGPVEDPRYVVVAVLEESGFGGVAAVPLVRQIFERLDPVAAINGRPALPAPGVPPGVSTTTTAAGSGGGAGGGAGEPGGASDGEEPAGATSTTTTPTPTTPAPTATAPVAPPTTAAPPLPAPTTTTGPPPTAPPATGPPATGPPANGPPGTEAPPTTFAPLAVDTNAPPGPGPSG
jgi:penicillin-binding protein 2